MGNAILSECRKIERNARYAEKCTSERRAFKKDNA